MKVLYLSYDGIRDPLGQSQILPYLKKIKSEVEYHIISFEKVDLEPVDLKEIMHHPIKYHKNPPVVSTLLDILLLKKKVKELHAKFKFDIIHCRGYITALVGMAMQSSGLPFVFDMRGFFADERRESGLWPKSNLLYNLIAQR